MDQYADDRRARRATDPEFAQQERDWNKKWWSTLSVEEKREIYERRRQQNYEWRIHAFDFFGWECVDCGETDIKLIEYDHIPGRGEKRCNPAQLHGEAFFYEVTEKCEPVCANCHRKRTNQRLRDGTAAHLVRQRTGIPLAN